MQSLSRENPINLNTLHSDLKKLILKNLPLKYVLLSCYLCRDFKSLDRTAEFKDRFENIRLVDFNFLRKRSKGDWAAFIATCQEPRLLPLVYKVSLSVSYVMWRPPTREIGQAITQFGEFMICYNHLYLRFLADFRNDCVSAAKDSAKKWASTWATKFNLPKEEQWFASSADIFNMAWQQSKEPLQGTYLGIAQVYGRDEVDVPEGVKQLQAMAPHCALAKLALGYMYRDGKGVEKNQVLAVNWLRSAADQKNASAQYALAQLYEQGNGVKQDLKGAFNLYRRAADLGDLTALNHLASMYHNGQGVKQDIQEALRLFRVGAEKNHANAQYNLAIHYLEGYGVTQDFQEALHWLFLSATQDCTQAQIRLGGLYEEGRGVEKNLKEAIRWYKNAANQDDAKAQLIVGGKYFIGKGVDKNEKTAAKWFRRAAENSNVDAQTNMGYLCTNGIGVEKNVEEAIKWYRLAAEQNSCLAKLCLGVLLPPGEEADQFFEQGKKDVDAKLLIILSSESTEVAKQILARLKR